MEVITKLSKYYGVQGIYALVNINKFSKFCSIGTPYIGQASAKAGTRKFTMGIGQRICDHRSKLRKGLHNNPKLQRAWSKYGEQSFAYFQLELVENKSYLTDKEQCWMNLWQSCKFGYNCQNAEEPLSFRKRSVLTYDIIETWIKQYYDEYDKWPSAASGKILYAPENEPLTWQALCMNLKHGNRGLPGGVTLADFIFNELGGITRKTAKKISETDVLEWIESFYKLNGYYPTNKTKGLVECASEYGKITWHCLDVLLRKGQRGLLGGNSVFKCIKKYGKNPIKFQRWYREVNSEKNN